MSVSIVMRCDINTCKSDIQGPAKKTRILDKEYDLCSDCYAKLTDFVGRRLEGGKSVADAPSTGTIQISGGQSVLPGMQWWGNQPYSNTPSTTMGGYTTGPISLPYWSSSSSFAGPQPSIPSDICDVLETMLGAKLPSLPTPDKEPGQ